MRCEYLAFFTLVSSPEILGQTKPRASDDVVRTKTELVQTDVTPPPATAEDEHANIPPRPV
jgi:hypothetical protein